MAQQEYLDRIDDYKIPLNISMEADVLYSYTVKELDHAGNIKIIEVNCGEMPINIYVFKNKNIIDTKGFDHAKYNKYLNDVCMDGNSVRELIYLLYAREGDEDKQDHIYVGKTRQLRERLYKHNYKNDNKSIEESGRNFEYAFVFVPSEKNINIPLNVIGLLEDRIIKFFTDRNIFVGNKQKNMNYTLNSNDEKIKFNNLFESIINSIVRIPFFNNIFDDKNKILLNSNSYKNTEIDNSINNKVIEKKVENMLYINSGGIKAGLYIENGKRITRLFQGTKIKVKNPANKEVLTMYENTKNSLLNNKIISIEGNYIIVENDYDIPLSTFYILILGYSGGSNTVVIAYNNKKYSPSRDKDHLEFAKYINGQSEVVKMTQEKVYTYSPKIKGKLEGLSVDFVKSGKGFIIKKGSLISLKRYPDDSYSTNYLGIFEKAKNSVEKQGNLYKVTKDIKATTPVEFKLLSTGHWNDQRKLSQLLNTIV